MSLVKRKKKNSSEAALPSLSKFNYPTLFPSFVDSILGTDFFDLGVGNAVFPGNTLPAVNIYETKDDFRIEVAAPGRKKEDFKINLDENRLIISSETEMPKEERESEDYTRMEFCYGPFQRSFNLPKGIVADKIEAHYDNGVLSITAPKAEEAKRRTKEIPISV